MLKHPCSSFPLKRLVRRPWCDAEASSRVSQACLASISLCVRLYGRVSAYRAIVHSVADWPAPVFSFVPLCSSVRSCFLLTVQSFTGLCFSPWLVKVLAISLMCRARLRRVGTQASFSPGPVRQSRAMLKHPCSSFSSEEAGPKTVARC